MLNRSQRVLRRCLSGSRLSSVLSNKRFMTTHYESSDKQSFSSSPYAALVPLLAGAMVVSQNVECEPTASGVVTEGLVENSLASTTAALQYHANPNNEDRTISSMLKFGSEGLAMYCVFDGHGGHAVSDLARNIVKDTLQTAVSRLKTPTPDSSRLSVVNEDDLKSLMRSVFASLDNVRLEQVKDALATKAARIGACALTVLVAPDLIVAANAGDCKAVMSRKGKAVALSHQHTANDAGERLRLAQEHPGEQDIVRCKQLITEQTVPSTPVEKLLNAVGMYKSETIQVPTTCYVKGRLQPTRALGDYHLKLHEAGSAGGPMSPQVRPPYSFPYITSDPETLVFKRDVKNDEFVVLGSDGVWDFLNDQQAVDIVSAALKDYTNATITDIDRKAVSAAEFAAKRLFDAVMQRAAEESGMTLEQLFNLAPGMRRRYHDDTTIVVGLLNHGAVSFGAAKL